MSTKAKHIFKLGMYYQQTAIEKHNHLFHTVTSRFVFTTPSTDNLTCYSGIYARNQITNKNIY